MFYILKNNTVQKQINVKTQLAAIRNFWKYTAKFEFTTTTIAPLNSLSLIAELAGGVIYELISAFDFESTHVESIEPVITEATEAIKSVEPMAVAEPTTVSEEAIAPQKQQEPVSEVHFNSREEIDSFLNQHDCFADAKKHLRYQALNQFIMHSSCMRKHVEAIGVDSDGKLTKSYQDVAILFEDFYRECQQYGNKRVSDYWLRQSDHLRRKRYTLMHYAMKRYEGHYAELVTVNLPGGMKGDSIVYRDVFGESYCHPSDIQDLTADRTRLVEWYIQTVKANQHATLAIEVEGACLTDTELRIITFNEFLAILSISSLSSPLVHINSITEYRNADGITSCEPCNNCSSFTKDVTLLLYRNDSHLCDVEPVYGAVFHLYIGDAPAVC